MMGKEQRQGIGRGEMQSIQVAKAAATQEKAGRRTEPSPCPSLAPGSLNWPAPSAGRTCVPADLLIPSPTELNPIPLSS